MTENKVNYNQANNKIENNNSIENTERRKLRKVKRPKVKTNLSSPVAPDKIYPIQEDTIINENIKSNNQITTIDKDNNLNNYEINNITSSDNKLSYNENQFDVEEEVIYNYETQNKTLIYVFSGICLIIGILIGKIIFSSQTIEKHGLEGVVTNQDIPSGRPRCGLTDPSQACVFYIMNWYKQELTGRDFYKLAAQLTGREEYMIETDNLRYATIKIKPGHFAQLNIPAIK